MPPVLQIYGLTRQRNQETLDRFLEDYLDRAAEEVQGDQEIYLNGPKKRSGESEAAVSLSHVILRGLEQPPLTFAYYMNGKYPKHQVDSMILTFTSDNAVVLGLGVDDPLNKAWKMTHAKQLLQQLVKNHDCHLGIIGAELPPPRSEKEFLEELQNPFYAAYWAKDGSYSLTFP